MKDSLWLVPAYYKSFSCKADKCRNSCCRYWRIPISHEEYNRLITMDCSPELNDRLNRAFITPNTATEQQYRLIGFNWLGDCPINKDGLCLLHSEKGVEYLPDICRRFPRASRTINGHNVLVCSSACEKVVELLLEGKDVSLEPMMMDDVPLINVEIPAEDTDMIKDIQAKFANRSSSLAERIAEVCRIVNAPQFEQDFNTDDDPVGEIIYILEHLVKENSFLAPFVQEVFEHYQDSYAFYWKDRMAFENQFPQWMPFFEKLINNSMMYENFPFVDSRFGKTGAYKGLCATYGLLRFMSAGYTALHPTDEDLCDVIAALFHLIDHTAFYYNINVITSNAASLLKL